MKTFDARLLVIAAASVAAVMVLLMVADYGCTGSTDRFCKIAVLPLTRTIDRWQSLLGAVLALLAALSSAWLVLRQIRQSETHEAGRIARRRRSQRALMPMVMSQVCDFAEESCDGLRQALAIAARHEAGQPDPVNLCAPSLSDGVIKDIVNMIEVSQGAEADAYIELLSELQVHAARWRGLASGKDRVVRMSIEEEFVDAAEIYARASNIIAADRPAVAILGKPTSRVGGVRLLGLHGPEFDGVEELAAGYDSSRPLTSLSRGAG